MSDDNYKSLDFCLDILYDKIYNSETKKCYIVPPIVKSDIDIEMLKLFQIIFIFIKIF